MRSTIMLLAMTALLGATGAARAATPAPHPVESAYGRAVAAAQAADWAACLGACDEALALAPGQPALQRRRAEALVQLGRGDEAMEVLSALAGSGVALDLSRHELLSPLRGRADWPAVDAVLAATLAPHGEPATTFVLPPDLVPEGIAWDPRDDVFYVGSVAQRRLLRVARDGTATEVLAPGAHGYLAGLGVAVDAQRRRLWAVSTAQADDGLFDAATVGRSAVHVLDLAGGGLLWSHVTAQADSLGFNDVCVLPDGGAAVSVADRGQVLLYSRDGGEPRALVAPGALPGANGLCVGPRGDCLYVSAYGLGLMRVGLADGVVTPATIAGATFTTFGIDGLYLLPGGAALIAVQNHQGLDRVAVFELDDEGLAAGCRVLASRLPMFVDPTTGAVAGDGFHFIADSYVSPFYGRADKGVLTGFGASRVLRVDWR